MSHPGRGILSEGNIVEVGGNKPLLTRGIQIFCGTQRSKTEKKMEVSSARVVIIIVFV